MKKNVTVKLDTTKLYGFKLQAEVKGEKRSTAAMAPKIGGPVK